MAGEETTNQQGNINANYNAAQTGLDMDKTLGQIPKGKLTYALNAAVENYDSNSVNYQNEEGNELCLEFPAGYVLIGKHYIQEKAKHIFFLVNPTTGDSQIGYMVNNDCQYHSLLSAACLNFDINYPIHKVVHRITNCETQIYWTDGLNDRRFLDIENVPVLTSDCNKLRVQPDFAIPQIDVSTVEVGGDLKAGTYQFAVQYCDAQGFGYTSYYSVTNPFSIADPDATTPNFDYPVNKSFKLLISNLELAGYYQYFNLAVIKTVNAITSVELVGTYYINQTTEEILYTGQNQTQIRLTVQDIFEKFPYYSVAQDVTSVQDILIWDQLTSAERVNYQSIAAQIDLQWQTYKMPATSNYADPLNTGLLRGYLRDEVYAFEIVFLLKNGKQTDSFHIPGRTAVAGDLTTILDTNPDYIGPGTSAPKWKIYNTASVTGAATGDPINGATPYEYGEFSYWESEEDYPASTVFTGAGLTGKIRHHKFPDVLVSPVFESVAYPGGGAITPVIPEANAIYPIGVRIDTQQVWNLIQSSGLTAAQKAEITGFKLIRGSRSTNKSIIAKGILRNVGVYERQGTTYLFPNYPYNDVNIDPFLLEVDETTTLGKAYGYIKQAALYQISNVTTAGSIIYTDCMTGEAKEKQFVVSGGGSVCSLTKPLAVNGLVAQINGPKDTAVTVNIRTTGGTSTFNATSGYGSSSVSLIAQPDQDNFFLVDGKQPISLTAGSTTYTITRVSGTFDDGFLFPNLDAFDTAMSTSVPRERMVFNSPETSFGTPTLGSILKIENILFGGGKAHFAEVEKNAKYKFITEDAQEAALLSSYNLANATGTFDAGAMFTTYQAYLQIYINGITRRNYGYSFNSIASYNYWASVYNTGAKQRELDIAQYLVNGFQSVGDIYDINNYNRETSVYLKTNGVALSYPEDYNSEAFGRISEYSRFTISQKGNCAKPEELEDIKVMSYYGSLKNIAPSQYGQMYSYETLDTGFQFDFDSAKTVKTVFGGDTFISRFAFKTKLPFFIDNRVGAPDDSDVFYDEIGNVAYPKYWHSSRSILSNYTLPNNNTLQGIVSTKSTFFDCPNDPVFYPQTSTTTTTQAPGTLVASPPNSYYDGKIYMFAYGIPYFYVETSVNTDLRQATNNKDGDFYPHVSTGIPDRWLQEYYVPISTDNTYFYNITYSKQNSENFFSHLPFDWDGSQCTIAYPFRAIYSDPQVSDPTSKVNNWLIYRPVSFFDFPQSYGDLVSLDGIQNKAILARFENKSFLYNNLLTIDTSNPQAAYVGNDKLFSSAPPVDYAETDLGYVGSQHKFLLKIPAGQITVDAKRGQIFLLTTSEYGNRPRAQDITMFGSGVNRFMTDHLAFEILRYFPDVYIDNAFKGIGLSGVFDSKYERIIITKLDYIPQPAYIDSMTYNSETREFYVGEQVVELTDLEYFCNRSWTLSFNLNTGSWVSFHSYLPNYYIGDNNFFYSGKIGVGMWSHLTNTTLNNNYYGTIEPYVIEYPFAYQYHDEILQNLKDYTRVYKYFSPSDGVFNDNEKIQTDDFYFNKAILYNGQQNSGLLKLVQKPMHNLSAYNQYPIYHTDSKTITFTKSDSFYQYNTFWSVYVDKTRPMFVSSCESLSVDKVLNNSTMDYGTRSFKKEPLRAKGLLVRHILDDRSDIHMVSQFIVAPSQISYK